MHYLVRNVQFGFDGTVTIDYMDATSGIKTTGLAISHALTVPANQDYDDGIEALQDAVQELLKDAIEDLSLVESIDLTKEPEEDDDEE